MKNATNKRLELFLQNNGTDNKGRYLHEILRKDNDWWEYTHDFIQWVFPTDERSAFNFLAPVVSVPVRIQAPNIVESYIRFREFLRSTDWKHPNNHNLLRITRVIRSLTLFGHEDLAYEFCDDVCALVGKDPAFAESVRYWKNALNLGGAK